MFLIASLVHFAGVIFYGVFASGEKQAWADPPVEPKDLAEEPPVENGHTKIDPATGKPTYGATTGGQTVINGGYNQPLNTAAADGYSYNQGHKPAPNSVVRPGLPPRPANNISRPGFVQPSNNGVQMQYDPNDPRAASNYGYGQEAKVEKYDFNIPLNNLNKGGGGSYDRRGQEEYGQQEEMGGGGYGYEQSENRVDASVVHQDMYHRPSSGAPQYATRPEYVQQPPQDEPRNRGTNPFNRDM